MKKKISIINKKKSNHDKFGDRRDYSQMKIGYSIHFTGSSYLIFSKMSNLKGEKEMKKQIEQSITTLEIAEMMDITSKMK